MAHSEQVAQAQRLACVELAGRVDRSDLFDVLRSLREKGWRPHFNVLLDARGIRELVLGPGELEEFVTRLSEGRQDHDGQEHGTVAIAVERPLDFSAAHLYKALAAQHGFRVEVYWRMEEALEALGLEELPEAMRR